MSGKYHIHSVEADDGKGCKIWMLRVVMESNLLRTVKGVQRTVEWGH